MRTAILGAALLVLGAIAIATGILPVGSALTLGARVWSILLFVVAITVVTELAAEAGLFGLVARGAARLSSSCSRATSAFLRCRSLSPRCGSRTPGLCCSPSPT